LFKIYGNTHEFFTEASLAAINLSAPAALAGRLVLSLALAAGPAALLGGCGAGTGGGSAPVVKDPPPAPPGEMNSDDFIKQQAKAKKRR
jgi:hypothetical protein